MVSRVVPTVVKGSDDGGEHFNLIFNLIFLAAKTAATLREF